MKFANCTFDTLVKDLNFFDMTVSLILMYISLPTSQNSGVQKSDMNPSLIMENNVFKSQEYVLAGGYNAIAQLSGLGTSIRISNNTFTAIFGEISVNSTSVLYTCPPGTYLSNSTLTCTECIYQRYNFGGSQCDICPDENECGSTGLRGNCCALIF
jgi:hypothetical protein